MTRIKKPESVAEFGVIKLCCYFLISLPNIPFQAGKTSFST